MITKILFEFPRGEWDAEDLRAKLIFDDGTFIILNAIQLLAEMDKNNYKFN